MIKLPSGCSCSELSVFPRNWKTKNAKTSLKWYIKYRFYDPRFKDPKQIVLKGMNQFNALFERQEVTKSILTQEMDKLLKGGFNPFDKVLAVQTGLNYITPESRLLDAFKYAFNKVSVTERTKRDLKYILRSLEKAVACLGLREVKISELNRKMVKLLLENISKSADQFNKSRSYIMILLSELCELEVIETNPARDIRKRKTIKHIREILSPEERQRVDIHLKNNYPSFHRFLHIFFHSGARISEIIRLKYSEVDMINQRFKLVIRKGRQYKEEWKVIKDIALPFWCELMKEAQKDDFLFSIGLVPGKEMIQSYQITKRWNRLVKKPLNITADFYSLKHLHTTQVVEMLSKEEAARHNSHKSTLMVDMVYDVHEADRKKNGVQKLKNSFV